MVDDHCMEIMEVWAPNPIKLSTPDASIRWRPIRCFLVFAVGVGVPWVFYGKAVLQEGD